MLARDAMLLCFEALGDNCEFGLVQRRGGAEPLGLLRFAGFHLAVERRLDRLMQALDSGFAGLGQVETVRVEAAGAPGAREYLVWEDAFRLMYHSFQPEGSIAPEALRAAEARKLGFLRRKFLDDLAAGEKLLVWKANLAPSEAAILRLLARLRTFGPNTLLWVAQADGANPAGTVGWRADGLLKGYVERFAPYEAATDIAYASWFAMCAEAHRLWRGPRPAVGGDPAPAAAVSPEAAFRQGHAARRAGRPVDARFDDPRQQDAWLAGWASAKRPS